MESRWSRKMAGPTAKDGRHDRTWGQLPLNNNRKDFADRPQSVDNLDIYDLHRYNAIGTTYASDVNTIQGQVPLTTPLSSRCP